MALADKLEPSTRKAFMAAIDGIKSSARIKMAEIAIASRDFEGLFAALGIDEKFFDPLAKQIGDVFNSGGVYQMGHLPVRPANLPPAVMVFQGRNLRAENWIREKSSKLIFSIASDQKDAIRAIVGSGLAKGDNPRKTALDIVGRITEGKRQGGIVGLADNQIEWLQSAQTELTGPISKDQLSNYLGRKLRDKRFDGQVKRAARTGKPLTQTQIDKISGRYSDRLLKHRADTIAQHETLEALNAGKFEALQQLVDDGLIAKENNELEWDSTGDARVRPQHQHLDGKTVNVGDPFVADDGSRLLYPHDTSLGATAAMIVGCRCYAKPKINWLAKAV
jgi:hypothetical protein